jgi:hypothetical protein
VKRGGDEREVSVIVSEGLPPSQGATPRGHLRRPSSNPLPSAYSDGANQCPITSPVINGRRVARDGVALSMDNLHVLLERLTSAAERIVQLLETQAQHAPSATKVAVPQAQHSGRQETTPLPNNLPEEVSTAQAAKILGVSKDTVLAYREKGLLPFRNLAPPGSTKPVYMFPLEAVVKLRTTYETEQQTPAAQSEPTRRSVKGRRKYKHVILDEEAES